MPYIAEAINASLPSFKAPFSVELQYKPLMDVTIRSRNAGSGWAIYPERVRSTLAVVQRPPGFFSSCKFWPAFPIYSTFYPVSYYS